MFSYMLYIVFHIEKNIFYNLKSFEHYTNILITIKIYLKGWLDLILGQDV